MGIFSEMLVNRVTIQSIEVKLTAAMASKKEGCKVRNVLVILLFPHELVSLTS